MTREKLLDAIGGVDEDMLAQSEEVQPRFHGTVMRRLMLVAAVIGLMGILLGAVYIYSMPIQDFRLVGGTESVEMDGKLVITGPQDSVHIEMEFPVKADVTPAVRCCYLPQLAEGWGKANGGAISSGFGINEVRALSLSWDLPGMAEGEFFWYYQESAYYHTETYEEIFGDLVASVTALPEGITLSAENEMLGPYHVLRVTVDPVRHLTEDQQRVDHTSGSLMPDGEVLVIWSDGYHVFQLHYPAWVPDETILAFMESLQPVDTDMKRVVAEYVGYSYQEKGE